MSEQTELNLRTFKDLITLERFQEPVVGSVEEKEIQDQIINLPSEVGGINLEQTNVEPCSSKKVVRREETDERKKGQGAAAESNDFSTPEVISLIFNHLDFHSLKKARLVCKRWLGLAQFYMERTGIAVLRGDQDYGEFHTKIDKFLKVYNKKLADLPQAFKSVAVDFNNLHEENPRVMNQISSLLPAPLVLTRFSPGEITLKLAFPLILQCSSTLEYLQIYSRACEGDFLPPMEPKGIFPKLRHLEAEVSAVDDNRVKNNFTSIVAWIVQWNPIEKFESLCALSKGVTGDDQKNLLELCSQFLLNVDIRNVENLELIYHTLNKKALEHFLSIPFTKLEHLNVRIFAGSIFSLSREAIISTVKSCVNTLRILNLSFIQRKDQEFVFARLPVCPNVQELHIISFRSWNDYVSFCFPSLQVLNIWMGESEEGDEIMDPFSSLKTLRIQNACLMAPVYFDFPLALLTTFPSVERLYIHSSSLMSFCGCSVDPKFFQLLEGVKHLEIDGEGEGWWEETQGTGYAFLRVLKGLETITMLQTNETVTTIPVTELPCLKTIYFPWGECLNMKGLLKLARGVETVGITNCCSIRHPEDAYSYRDRESWESRKLLIKFLDSAPNAQCGCKYWKELSKPRWYSSRLF